MRKVIVIIIFIIITVFTVKIIQNKEKKSYVFYYENEIKGVINKVFYGMKNETYIVVNDVEYSLFLFDVRKEDGLKKGDSIYKAKNSKILELHSKKSNGGYFYTKDFRMK